MNIIQTLSKFGNRARPALSRVTHDIGITATRVSPREQSYVPLGYVRVLTLSTALTVTCALVGCGNTLYLVQINRAEQNFRKAQELGAEEYAPYEYYSAKVRLEEAQRQAAQAEYGPATDLSDEAYDFSVKAINAAKEKRESEGQK